MSLLMSELSTIVTECKAGNDSLNRLPSLSEEYRVSHASQLECVPHTGVVIIVFIHEV